jgi:hypothetical protein
MTDKNASVTKLYFPSPRQATKKFSETVEHLAHRREKDKSKM